MVSDGVCAQHGKHVVTGRQVVAVNWVGAAVTVPSFFAPS
jgi:hypothetical protein